MAANPAVAKRVVSTTSSTVNVDAVLATIRQQESGGNYAIQTSGGSDASGAYQYINSTWAAMFQRAMAAGYLPAGTPFIPRAGDNPPSVQDAVARYDVTTFLNSVGGNVALVPLHWYYPASINNPSLLNFTPPGNSISIGQYQSNWLGTYSHLANDPTALAAVGTTGTRGGGATATTTGSIVPGVPSWIGNIPILGGLVKGATLPARIAAGLVLNWRYAVQIMAGLFVIGIGLFFIARDTGLAAKAQQGGQQAAGAAAIAAAA